MSYFVWHYLDWYILFLKESLAGIQCRLQACFWYRNAKVRTEPCFLSSKEGHSARIKPTPSSAIVLASFVPYPCMNDSLGK